MSDNLQPSPDPLLLKPFRPVGIAGYGAYVPRYRLPAKEVLGSGLEVKRVCLSKKKLSQG